MNVRTRIRDHKHHDWWVLAIVGLAQLTVVLDGSIVNIALPQAQIELGLSDTARQWVVTAYALPFGAFLLLGGRIADYWGRRRAFIVGMVGFGLASALGGLVTTGEMLIAARAVQGVFAALLAPAGLSILTTTFATGRHRNTAFAVYGIISGVGAAVGLVVGGLLTELLSWRWCLLVNVPIAVAITVGALLVMRVEKVERQGRLDILGAVLVGAALAGLVFGLTQAEYGWGQPAAVVPLAVGVVLLIAFVVVERRSSHPLLPLIIVTDRVRAGAFIGQLLSGSVIMGALLYLTFYLQLVLGLQPLLAGLASLPITLVILVFAPIYTKLLPLIGARTLVTVGPLVAGAGLLYLSRVTPDSSYFVGVLPALVLIGLGMGALFVPIQNLALSGVEPRHAGAASATSNAMMQVGGSIGLAIYTTIYTAVETSSTGIGLEKLVDGYSAVFVAAAVATLLISITSFVLIRTKATSTTTTTPVMHLG